MDGLRRALLEFFFPSRCCFCRRLTRNGSFLCRACAGKYPDRPPGQRERALTRTLRCLSPLRYEGEARRALLRYKFGGLPGYAAVFGAYMRECLDGGDGFDCVAWVPLSAKRLRKRGYDQARLLAEELAERLGLPCLPLLEKTRHSPAQSGLHSREQRRRNAAGAYRCAGGAAGKRILLIDDIVTSGVTLTECARVLRQAGARSVTAITAASRD